MNADQYAAAYEESFHTAVRFFQSRGVPRDDAMECVQAAWVRGWQKKQQLRKPAAILPWIISIGRNLRNNRLRQERPPQATAISRAATSLTDHVEAQQILSRAKPEDRLLLESFYFEGLTADEIAGPEGVSAATVRCRLRQARRNALAKCA